MSPLPMVSYAPLDAGAATSSPEAEEVSVSTVAATAVATGHLMLKLEGYSRLKATHGENGTYIESSAVEVGGHTWRIRCYLNGISKKDTGFISLYLYSSDSVAHAEYEIALVRHQGTPPAYGHQGTLSQRSEGMRIFEGKDDIFRGWGFPRFISVKELERSRVFLKDDCFAVRCTVTVVEERTMEEKVVVQAHDMERLGLGTLCKCDDDLCKRQLARPAAETFFERFANFCYSICRGGR